MTGHLLSPPLQRLVRFLALVGTLSLAPAAASAQPTATEHERWQDLQEQADAGARHARYWTIGWGTFHGVSLGRNIYLASDSSSSATRFDARVDSVKSLLALGDIVLNPLPHPSTRARIAELAAKSDQETDALQRARYAIQKAALEEQHRRRPAALQGSLLVNLTAGSVIAFGDDRPTDGIRNAALGMLVSGVQAWTQPTTLSQGLHRRNHGVITIADQPLHLQYVMAVTPGYASVKIRW